MWKNAQQKPLTRTLLAWYNQGMNEHRAHTQEARTMRHKAALTGALLAGTFAAVVLGGLLAHQAQPTCTEDMACWNCETMGNLVCGTSANTSWAVSLPYPLDQAAYYLIDTFVEE